MSTPWVIIAVNFCASNHNGRRQAHPVRRGTLIAWGGDRLTPLAAGRDRFARHYGRHTRIVGAKTRGCVSCFHKLICFATAHIDNASSLRMVSMLVSHYRLECSDVVKPASAVEVSLHHHMWRLYSVAERVQACLRSNPAKLVAASSCRTPSARDAISLSLWNSEDAVEIVPFDADRNHRSISTDRFIHAVLNDVDDLEGFIELLFCSCYGPQHESTEIRRGDDMFAEVEFVYGSRHGDTNYKRVCSLSPNAYEV